MEIPSRRKRGRRFSAPARHRSYHKGFTTYGPAAQNRWGAVDAFSKLWPQIPGRAEGRSPV